MRDVIFIENPECMYGRDDIGKSLIFKYMGSRSNDFIPLGIEFTLYLSKELLKRFNGNFIRMIMSCVKTMKYVQCLSWIYSFLYALCSQQSKPHKEAESKKICR